MEPQNKISVGLSNLQPGADGYITQADCIGAPNVYCLQPDTFAVGCYLLQCDVYTNFSVIVWKNTGTVAVPAWTQQPSISPVVAPTDATVTLTQAQSGSTVVLNRAAGTVVTLPTPVAGMTFEFVVPTSVTSNSYKVITGTPASEFLLGSLVNIDTDTSNAVAAWTADGTTIVAITMNGTTTGGLKGTTFRLTAINSIQWMVTGIDQGNGTVATPFATS